MIYYGKSIQGNISKGKVTWGEKFRGTRSKLPESPRVYLITAGTHVKCCQPRKLLRDSVLKIFTGSWSHRQSLSGINQIQTPIRKAGAQYKPHCLNKQSRHSEPLLSDQLPEWKPFPCPSSQMSTLEAGLPKHQQAGLSCQVFLHRYHICINSKYHVTL